MSRYKNIFQFLFQLLWRTAIQNNIKLALINDIYCVFFEGIAAICTFVPVIGLVAGIAITGGAAAIAYPAAAAITEKGRVEPLTKKLKDGSEALKKLDDAIFAMKNAVKDMQEEIHTKKKKMEDIYGVADEATIYANDHDAQYDHTFGELKKALIKLQSLCTDWLSV